MTGMDNVRLVHVQDVTDRQAKLCIFETEKLLPFPVRRIFTVHAREKSQRGRHAHKVCSQAMTCLAGICDITVDDGTARQTWRLDEPGKLLIVPPLLWCEQDYQLQGTILMVICDYQFEEDEYIRDYSSFLAHRNELISR